MQDNEFQMAESSRINSARKATARELEQYEGTANRQAAEMSGSPYRKLDSEIEFSDIPDAVRLYKPKEPAIAQWS